MKGGKAGREPGRGRPRAGWSQAAPGPGGAHVVGNDTSTHSVWSTKTGKVTARVPVPNVPTALAFSRDGRHFAAAVSPFLRGNTFVVTYDVNTGAKVAEAGLSSGVVK